MTVTVTAGSNDAPTADAGENQTVGEGAAVTLAGSGTDPENEALTYAWTQTSGQSVTLDDATAQGPAFTAPTELVSDAVLVFSLVVTDARGAISQPDTVTVTVTAGANDAPTADAGENQTVGEGAAVTLAGSGTDPEGEALTYAWTQTGGESVTLSGASTATASFTAPTELVTDARGSASQADTVTITVTAGANDAPTADAGENQTVGEGASVTLAGSGTDPEGEALTYRWTQDSGQTVSLSNDRVARPSFTAPTELVTDAVLVFSLVVTDARNAISQPDTVTVTVTAGSNDPPTADAGENQTVGEGASVTLAGSGSDPENEALTYQWTQDSGQSVTLSGASAATASFTAPTELVSDAVLVFSLVVTDARGAISQPDTVTITVTAGANDAPTADAGENQTVGEGAAVTLTGSGSDPEGEALTYAWTQTGGANVSLDDDTAQGPAFTAPTELVTDAALVFSLVVTDARGSASQADTVTVTVTAGSNDAPTANAGENQTVGEGAAVTLAGSGTDPEGEALTYAWTQTGGANVSLDDDTAQGPAFTAPTELVGDAALVFSLVVTDARGSASSPDTVTVTVTAGANDAPTADAGENQTVAEGAAVTLAGSGTDPEGEALTYAWTQTGGQSVTLSGASAATASFTAPTELVTDAALVFSLVVTDARGSASQADTVTVTVTAGANDAPTADAGENQTVGEGASVTLAGSGTDPEGEALTYRWTQTSGQTVSLSNDRVATASFTAPTELVSDAVLVFSLVVTDARGSASVSDTVTITVTITVTAGSNDAPTADAGDGQTVGEGASVTLSGSGTDPENEALTYQWTQTSGANVSLDDDTAQGPAFTAPTELVGDAALVFSLVVTDARGSASSPDTVTVTVTAGANDAPTADAGENQTVAEGAAVTLAGSGTDPEGEALTYAWTQTGGQSVTLSGASAATASFTAPTELVTDAALVFSLVVTDAVID